MADNVFIKHLSRGFELWRLQPDGPVDLIGFLLDRLGMVYGSRVQVALDLAPFVEHSHFLGVLKEGELVSTTTLTPLRRPDGRLEVPEGFETAFDYDLIAKEYALDEIILGLRNVSLPGMNTEDSDLVLRGVYDYINHIRSRGRRMALLETMDRDRRLRNRSDGIPNHFLGLWASSALPGASLDTTITFQWELQHVWSEEVRREQDRRYQLLYG